MDMDDGENNRYEPLEYYLAMNGESSWVVKMGQFIENFGYTDTRSPMNILNRLDLASDPFEPVYLGEWGIHAGRGIPNMLIFKEPFVSVFILPVARDPQYPSDSHRFSPSNNLVKFKKDGDFTARLAWLEECKTLPLGAVWDYYCLKSDTPAGLSWLDEVKKYEESTTSKR